MRRGVIGQGCARGAGSHTGHEAQIAHNPKDLRRMQNILDEMQMILVVFRSNAKDFGCVMLECKIFGDRRPEADNGGAVQGQ